MRSGVLRGLGRPPIRAPCRPIVPRAPQLPHYQPKRNVQACSYSSRMGIRAAIADKLASARTWQDVQQIINQYGDYLTPAEIQQIISAAPGMNPTRSAPTPRQPLAPRQQRAVPRGSKPQARQFITPAEAQARRAAAQAEAQRRQAEAAQAAARDQQAYRNMMNQLAQYTRQSLPQITNTQEGPRLADTAYALAHAGALDEGLAHELLQHTAQQASQGQLDVQGLADVLAALGKARFRPTPAIMNQLLRDVDPVSRCTSAQELSALLRGLASLGYEPDASFVESVMQRLNQRQAESARAAADSAALRETKQAAGAGGGAQKRGQQAAGAASRGATPGRAQGKPGAPQQVGVNYQEGEEEVDEDEEEQRVFEREQEEARHVAAAVQALQRMGATRQAAELKATYLKDLQTRAAQRLQARQARDAQRRAAAQRAEQARQEQAWAEQKQRAAAQQRAEQQRLEQQQRAEQQRLEQQQRAEQQRVEAMQVAVRTAIDESRTWQKLQTILYNYPQWLGPQELTAVLVQLVSVLSSTAASLTWRDRAELNEMLQAWGGLLVESVAARGIEPAQLVSCLQAMTALKWLDQELLGFLLRESKKRLTEFTAQQLVGVMRSLAVAGLRPSQAFLDAFLQESTGKLADCSPVDMRDLATSLARLNVQPGAAWVLAYLGALQAKEASLTDEEASSCLQAAAALDTALVQRWYAGLVDSRRAQGRQQQQVPAQQQQQQQPPRATSTAKPSAPAPAPAPTLRPALTSLSDDMLPEALDSPLETDTESESEATTTTTTTSAQPNPPSASSSAGAAKTAVSGAAGKGAGRGASPDEAGSPLDPPDSIYSSLPLDVQSVDFDEEAGSSGVSALPDEFLLDRLQTLNSQPASAAGSEAGEDVEEAEVEVVPPEPFTPAQLKAFRSVLLERLELAEESEAGTRERLAAAQTRVENAAIQLSSVRSQLDTLQADFERVRTRHQNEKDELSLKVKLDVLAKLLPVLDNFDRAAMSLKPATEGEKQVAAAYQAVAGQIQELLKSAGVEEVPGAGQPFDPAVHDAIMQEVNPDVPDGTVLMVLQKGFKAGERLLRPALVKVSSA